MTNSVQDRVRDYYDNRGWKRFGEHETAEDYYFRKYKNCSSEYRAKYNEKVLKCFEDISKDVLLIAGCGDMPESHIKLAQQFNKVICVDISSTALEVSRKKLGNNGEFIHGSLLDLPVEDRKVQAVLCSHVLYHIDKKNQQLAVEKMINALKPGGILAVFYTNPRSPLMLIQRFLKFAGINKLLKRDLLYFYSYPLKWWNRYKKSCNIQIFPLEVMSNDQERALIPDNRSGEKFFNWAEKYERDHPENAKCLWSYIGVLLIKKQESGNE